MSFLHFNLGKEYRISQIDFQRFIEKERLKMKVALYARVSTEKQEEEGTIDSQIVALEEYCQKNGHVIVGKYIDNGYSGTLLARPELDKLRDDASKEIFDAILIHSPDRLARKYVYQELVIEELKAKEIQIIFS